MPITTSQFLALYPRLYHMAEAGTWPSIEKLGLLSTTALLDRFGVSGQRRFEIESQHRPECVSISHPNYGSAVIRDQKPMSQRALQKCLLETTPREWYELLNRRVFFWVTEERVKTLLSARAYKNREHDVLIVETSSLLAKHINRTTLSPLNSGSTVYNPQPRGRETFRPFDTYLFEQRAKYGKRAVAELAVDYSVPDMPEHVLRVERRSGQRIVQVVYDRRGG